MITGDDFGGWGGPSTNFVVGDQEALHPPISIGDLGGRSPTHFDVAGRRRLGHPNISLMHFFTCFGSLSLRW